MTEIKKSLSAIMDLYGMDEFKELAKKLCVIAKNRQQLSSTTVYLPNYFFVTDAGCGVTTHIKLLANLIAALRLHPFQGERRFFEMVIDEDAFKQNQGFDRLLHLCRQMAGFHEHFCGVVGLEINDWVDHAGKPELDRLLSYVEDMHGSILFVFEVDMKHKDKLNSLLHRFSMEMPLEIVHFHLPDAAQLCQQMDKFLSRRGFALSGGAYDELLTLMPRLTALKDFDGYQSLENLADELVYHYLSGGSVSTHDIPAEALGFVTAPGGYLDRLASRYDRDRRRIGFA